MTVMLILSAGSVGSCTEGSCQHPRARNWIQCDICKDWYHCLCAKVKAAEAESCVFKCNSCEI